MKFLTQTPSLATVLRCSACGKEYSLSVVNTYSPCCNEPLTVAYDVSKPFFKEDLAGRENTLWRYFEMLPLKDSRNIISLSEGMTPILSLENLANKYGLRSLLLKDESHNPTGSFKARGLSVAVSRAKELGIEACIIATAGNAGGALAAYCAKAGMPCTVVMPAHTPRIFKDECELYGAELILVEGLINDCAKKVQEIKEKNSCFDVSTFKEPYRLEGKKTMGYEIAEQLHWDLPDAIVYPTGGGTGLIGIWKAFKEMLKLGWISGPLPKMIAVQAANCAPLVAAYKNPAAWKQNFSPKPSVASGLAVPYPFAMNLMLKVLYESEGDVVVISEESIVEGVKEVAENEGLLLSPEGSATWKALSSLIGRGVLRRENKILLLNTGSGYKYIDSLTTGQAPLTA